MAAIVSSFVFHHVRSFGNVVSQRIHHPIHKRAFASTTTSLLAISEKDEEFLSQAIEHAKYGLSHTYPNPAVGCVLVRQDTDQVVGSGFHPRAGSPHAEVFALLEAAGHVPDGIAAAKAVLAGDTDATINQLVETYLSENGPEQLFADTFDGSPITAYVTLEPCSHHGQTPPCSVSLALSKASRVVVGFRDPNPLVDGGGVKLLREAGVEVEMAQGDISNRCAALVEAFVKRQTPKDFEQDYSWMNGAFRSGLRRLAGTKKKESSLAQVNWIGHIQASDEDSVDSLVMNSEWMERLDALLWKDELVNLKLNKAVGKKKLARRLGERIAKDLNAHVAQTVGHTALLYRPGLPPVLNLEELAANSEEELVDNSKD
jgi:pyrimidine deaminase RibD-like protein/RNA-binding protein YhbY